MSAPLGVVRATVSLALALCAASPAGAQARSAEFATWDPAGAPELTARVQPVPASRPADAVTLGFAGLLGSAAGVFGGGFVGYQISRADGDCGGDDWCGFTAGFVGAVIGSAVLTPVAVHMANGGRGDLGSTVVMSSLITGAGAAIALVTDSPEILLAVPLAAIIGSVAVERSTTPGPE